MLVLVAFVQVRLKEQFNSKANSMKINGHRFDVRFFFVFILMIHLLYHKYLLEAFLNHKKQLFPVFHSENL